MLKITKDRSISTECEKILNELLGMYLQAWSHYMCMASWCEVERFEGSQAFMYHHAEEKQRDMMKIFRYINIAGAKAMVPSLDKRDPDYPSLEDVFQKAIGLEVKISNAVNSVVKSSIMEGDYATVEFLRYFVLMQRNKEDETRRAIALFDIINPSGDTGLGIYEVDEHVGELNEELHGENEDYSCNPPWYKKMMGPDAYL